MSRGTLLRRLQALEEALALSGTGQAKAVLRSASVQELDELEIALESGDEHRAEAVWLRLVAAYRSGAGV